MGFMRFFLAIAVLLWHCPYGVVPRFANPALAVQCFYTISGFLIQFVITTKYRRGSGWQGRFYLSRLLRLFPLYLLFLLLSLITFGTGYLSELSVKGTDAVAVWLVTNFLIAGQDVVRFFSFDISKGHWALLAASAPADTGAQTVFTLAPVSQAWTIAVELYFYLLAPLLLTRRTRVLVLTMCLSVALRLTLGAEGFLQPQWFYGFFPNELALFIAGALSCRAYAFFISSGALSARIGHHRVELMAGAVTAGICGSYLFVSVFSLGGGFNAPPVGLPPAYILLLLATVAALPFAFHLSRIVRFDRYLGELSYPIYISHEYVLKLLEKTPATQESSAQGLWVLLLSVALSVALIRFVEQPLDKVRHRIFVIPPSTLPSQETVKSHSV